MRHRGIGLILTRKCNADCDICCFSCSPREEAKMPLENALDLIEQASAIPSIRTVGITGGEPFLFYEELVKIAEACKAKSLAVTCTTNGYWGKTEQEAFEKMSKLKQLGMSFMTLSVDSFHAKFIPYESIRNILRASKKIQMGILISAVSTRSKRLKDVLGELGDDVMGIRVMEIPCSPVGNAATRIDQNDFIVQNEVPDEICNELHVLSITPDGRVYPCCSELGLIPPLCLGSINERSLSEIIQDSHKNLFCSILAHKGVKWFISIIKENNLPIKLKDKYVGRCDICNDLLEKADNIKYLEPFLQEYSVSCSRA